MCESIPPQCLPPPAHPAIACPDVIPPDVLPPEDFPRGVIPPRRVPRDVLRHHRRVVLAGLGSLLLTACAPARGSRIRARAAGLRPTAQPAVRPPPAYRIVRRSEWGAEPLKDNHDPMARVTRITLHHTAEVAGMGTRTDAELMKGIQDFHRNTRGWADIGYHWVIGLDGNVYEGRALNVQGAHAGGGNNLENLGISVIGDFTKALPGSQQLRTTERFLAAQLAAYRVPVTELYGHRDWKPTACPGDALYAWLERFKAVRA